MNLSDDDKYSQKTILEYRQKLKARHFEKKITERRAIALEMDEAVLSCGHTRKIAPDMIDLLESAHKLNKKPTTIKCDKCIEDWLNQQESEDK
jgi:hypothetical protein